MSITLCKLKPLSYRAKTQECENKFALTEHILRRAKCVFLTTSTRYFQERNVNALKPFVNYLEAKNREFHFFRLLFRIILQKSIFDYLSNLYNLTVLTLPN